jgi:hypothetical protein
VKKIEGKWMKKKVMIISLILILAVIVGGVLYLLTRPRELVTEEFDMPQAQASAEDAAAVEQKETSDAASSETSEDISAEDSVGTLVVEASGEVPMGTKQKDYVENQVVVVADSKSEAKKIAGQIGGELLSYDNQVAVIQIGITVEEMMQRLDEDPTLPKVYPNYTNYQNYSY